VGKPGCAGRGPGSQARLQLGARRGRPPARAEAAQPSLHPSHAPLPPRHPLASQPPPDLRRAANEEGEVRVLRPVTLSSFLDTPQAQRLLAAAPRRRLAGGRR
jgi:hypothetical protein